MKRLIDIECTSCTKREYDVWLEAGEYPHCANCGAPMQRLWSSTASAIGDDIPGGVLVKHGLCDLETGAPIRYYSKSAMAQEAKRRGLANTVRHVPDPYSGSDKAKYTTRWI